MALVRWDPMRELDDMSARFNRLFALPFLRPADENETYLGEFLPAMDVQEIEKEYLVKADLPDVKREDVKVAIEDGVLTIEGERKAEKEEKGKKLHRVERSYGKFTRRLALPGEVDEKKVTAEFKDGVLTVHLPKSAEVKPHGIEVKVA
jgi:HSP20 family protein